MLTNKFYLIIIRLLRKDIPVDLSNTGEQPKFFNEPQLSGLMNLNKNDRNYLEQREIKQVLFQMTDHIFSTLIKYENIQNMLHEGIQECLKAVDYFHLSPDQIAFLSKRIFQ